MIFPGLIFSIILFGILLLLHFLPVITDDNKDTIPKIKIQKYNPNISKITDNIWITDAENAKDYDTLKSLGIKQILTVGSELRPHGSTHFRTRHIKVFDSPEENIKKYFNTSNKFIEQAPTLVHCAAGISRSVTLVIAYLMKKNSWSFEQTLEYIKSKRTIANPNSGFRSQLVKYEKDISKFFV